jgi:hypothetical protein
MSIAASKLFLRPNCKKVNKKLKNRFKINGKAMIQGICLVNAL